MDEKMIKITRTGLVTCILLCALKRHRVAKALVRIICGFIIGVAFTFAMLALSSCTFSASQSPDGSWSYTGVIVIPVDEKGVK